MMRVIREREFLHGCCRSPIDGWCTEGFDMADVQEAKALLDELGG